MSVPSSMETLPLAAERIIPHRSPMCLVGHLIHVTGQSGTVDASVDRESIFLDDLGQLDRQAIVELVAQAYAAITGYARAMLGEPIIQGFLVGIRDFAIYEDIHGGDRVVIHVNTIKVFGGFAVAEGRVVLNDKLMATATIKVWIPPDPSTV